MDQISNWVNWSIEIIGAIGTLVTAIATFFLWRVTKLLAIETKRMAEASSQPHVVAVLSPNHWSVRHFDLNVENTGNAAAYDIRLNFTPPLENGQDRTHKTSVPLQEISILKPGSSIHSFLTDYESIQGLSFDVEISWRNAGKDNIREINSYTLRMSDHEGISYLGQEPLIKISRDIEKLEKNWSRVLKGNKRVNLDVFTSLDRLREKRDNERWVRKMSKQRALRNREQSSKAKR